MSGFGAMRMVGLMRPLLAGAFLCLLPLAPALAQGLVPVDFFTAPVDPKGAAGVEAETLTFDVRANIIRASGDVVLSHAGYVLTGDSLEFARNSNALRMGGRVRVTDPSGNVAEMDGLEIGGAMKTAILNALTITAHDGSRITADSIHYDRAMRSVLVDASYAPCGTCVDEKGRRIGWSVNAARIVHDAKDGAIYLEQPSLALLGVPVAWLPYLWLPNTRDTALARLRMPTLDYSAETGLSAHVPVMIHSSRWTDIILTPTPMTRQGFLMGAEWVQRFDSGSFQVKVSGLYQWDKNAFSGTVGARDWRGALQTSGAFRPLENWQAGWSYTAFTDPAYLEDYRLARDTADTNQLYATYLTREMFFDVRVQHFNLLGNVTPGEQAQQGHALPVTRFAHIHDLGPGRGRIELDGQILSVRRQDEAARWAGDVPYRLGAPGTKTHASLQAAWQAQWLGAGGLVFTPYAGVRADFAQHSAADPLRAAETSLVGLTPIAALDIRYPLFASTGTAVHTVEPIAQLVYRGSQTPMPGLTNDDAQSLVFDDTNLFSYNRFSGYDRQETGLRANIGARYQANFADGGYLELIGGQSFHLAGPNAFAVPDPALTGRGSRLENAASYALLSAHGAFASGLSLAGKAQIDTGAGHIARLSAGMGFTRNDYAGLLDYRYIAADARLGTVQDHHEIAGELTVPLSDYWRLSGKAAWDLGANNWLMAGAGLRYDDGYLAFGASAERTGPTHIRPDDTRLTATFQIKTPAGLDLGYSGALPSP